VVASSDNQSSGVPWALVGGGALLLVGGALVALSRRQV
jgi:LPXTG-motif cell wall-anchored protein